MMLTGADVIFTPYTLTLPYRRSGGGSLFRHRFSEEWISFTISNTLVSEANVMILARKIAQCGSSRIIPSVQGNDRLSSMTIS